MQKRLEYTVIVADKFNPSIFDRYWLIKNEIVSEEDFLPGGMYAEGISQISTKDFDIIVLPDRLQFNPKVPRDEADDVVNIKL